MAIKSRPYDIRQIYRGVKRSYAACTAAKITSTTATTIKALTVLDASSTTIIRLQKVIFGVTCGTAAIYADVALVKNSTVASGGTATNLVQVPLISTSAAGTAGGATVAAGARVYTAEPTEGTLVGTIGHKQVFAPITGTPATGVQPAIFDFTNAGELETPTLIAGSTQEFAIRLNTAYSNAVTFTVEWYWTEETSTGA